VPRGSKPGERRGGRKPGTPNKVTVVVKEAAQAFTADAISTLAEIMRSPEHPAAARVSAANALLDRGHGKPKQPLTGGEDDDNPIRSAMDLSALTGEQLAALAAIEG
jgi:hypothetical protein